MENVLSVCKFVSGVICGVATYLWGGVDAVLVILIALIVADYLTGILAAVYKREISSEVGFRGILKKVVILIIVALAHLAGQAAGVDWVRSVVIGFYIANEGISIMENAARMGVPLPKKLLEVLEQLKDGGDKTA